MQGEVARQAASPSLRVLRSQAEFLGVAGTIPRPRRCTRACSRSVPTTPSRCGLFFSRASPGRDRPCAGADRAPRRRRPELLTPLRERVEVLEGASRIEPALSVVNAAMPQLAGDPDWHERRGRLLLRLGRTDLAVQAYRRSLELKPQNPTLRKYLSVLDPQARSGEDLARAYRKTSPACWSRSRPPVQKGDAARVLLDQQVTRVHENGLSEVYAQRLVDPRRARRARKYGEHDIRFTPRRSPSRSKPPRSIAPRRGHGGRRHRRSQRVRAWYGLYYDVHAQSIRFTGLRPGDVVYVEYILADVGRRNLLSEYFGDVHFFQEEIPRLDSRYTLVLPRSF